MIIGKVRPALYICLVTSLWGILSISQGFTHSFSQFAAVRFILGLVEAPFIPAVMVLDEFLVYASRISSSDYLPVRWQHACHSIQRTHRSGKYDYSPNASQLVMEV
ncbi:hypothetical protein PG996_015033 [Apiospora saccharicola]|uniref:Uncharacterized protein n=1 Tax=Apiospora saccharicola TaxID=335842 RepID=A0ABR1TMM2_9PEZI